MKTDYSDFYVSGNKQLFAHCDYDHEGEGNYYDYISISGPNYNKYRSPFNFGSDQALVERLQKAFATLVEYNSTKKGADEKILVPDIKILSSPAYATLRICKNKTTLTGVVLIL